MDEPKRYPVSQTLESMVSFCRVYFPLRSECMFLQLSTDKKTYHYSLAVKNHQSKQAYNK